MTAAAVTAERFGAIDFLESVLRKSEEVRDIRRPQKRLSPAVRLGLGISAVAAVGVLGCAYLNTSARIDVANVNRVAAGVVQDSQSQLTSQNTSYPVEVFGRPRTEADLNAARTQAGHSAALAEVAGEIDSTAAMLGGAVLLAEGAAAIGSRRKKIAAWLRSMWAKLNEPLPAAPIVCEPAVHNLVTIPPRPTPPASAAEPFANELQTGVLVAGLDPALAF